MRQLWANLKALAAPRSAWSLADPAARRRASLHYHWQDHAILRGRWTNMAEVEPGVWLVQPPHPRPFPRPQGDGHPQLSSTCAARARTRPYLFERESCEALGLELVRSASGPGGRRSGPRS